MDWMAIKIVIWWAPYRSNPTFFNSCLACFIDFLWLSCSRSIFLRLDYGMWSPTSGTHYSDLRQNSEWTRALGGSPPWWFPCTGLKVSCPLPEQRHMCWVAWYYSGTFTYTSRSIMSMPYSIEYLLHTFPKREEVPSQWSCILDIKAIPRSIIYLLLLA